MQNIGVTLNAHAAGSLHKLLTPTMGSPTAARKNDEELYELVQHAVQDVSLYFFRKGGKLQKSMSSMLPFV